MLTIEFAQNPVYADPDGNCIALEVKFAEFADVLPFGATPHDPMAHGVELFNRAKAGEFGEIAPYPSAMQPAEDQPTVTGAQTL